MTAKEWIEEEQDDRIGIYPYKVIEQVADRFGLEWGVARELVLAHIRKESKYYSY